MKNMIPQSRLVCVKRGLVVCMFVRKSGINTPRSAGCFDGRVRIFFGRAFER